jgi:TP901 family phage tail tape measure protein
VTDDFKVRLEFDAQNAVASMQNLSRFASQAGRAMEEAGTASSAYAKSLSKIEREAARLSSGGGLVGSFQKQSSAMQSAAAQSEKLASTYNRWSNGRFQSASDAMAVSMGKQASAAGRADSALNSNRIQLQKLGITATGTNTALQNQIEGFTGVQRATTGITAANSAFNETAAQTKARLDTVHQSLSTTRYALYDVSASMGIAGAALVALSAATFAAGISWERDFASVVRTTDADLNPRQIDRMRQSFMDLASTLPITSSQLAEIGTLGGQLGISAQHLGSFTETVAKFTAVTDLTAEASATAFGRLNALLPDINGNFEGLGSAIALVGVRSVATESAIVNVATQISAAGHYAGLTVQEVIGLSGALASVGVAPFLARGTTTRLFAKMGEAASEGGDKLERFAKISGVSSEKFKSSFGTDKFGSVFKGFVDGLGSIDKQGGDTTLALKSLGIAGSLDVPVLQKLANAADSSGKAYGGFTQNLKDSKKGYKEAGELNRQYGIISDTVASKIQVLGNNFQNLLVTIGGGGGVFRDLISSLGDMLQNMTKMASDPFWGTMLQIGAILGGVLGIFLLLGAGVARIAASGIALSQAWKYVGPHIKSAGLAAKETATSMKTLRGAIASIGPMLAIFVALEAVNFAAGFREAQLDVDTYVNSIKTAGNATKAFQENAGNKDIFGNSFNKYKTDLKQFGKDLESIGTSDWLKDFGRLTFNSGQYTSATVAVDNFRDAFKKLQEQGKESIGIAAFQDVVNGAKLSNDALAALIDRAPEVKSALINMLDDAKIKATPDNIMKLARDDLPALKSGAESAAKGMDAINTAAKEAAAAIDEAKNAIANFNGEALNAEEANIAFYRAMNSVAEAAKASGASLTGTNEASLALRSSLVDAEKAARAAGTAIIDNGGDAAAAGKKYDEMRSSIIGQLKALGLSEGAANAWADTVLGTSAEAKAAFQKYLDTLGKTPKEKKTDVKANTKSATQNVVDYLRKLNGIPRSGSTTWQFKEIGSALAKAAAAGGGGSKGYLMRASGGYIRGPGTATSDSIPAMLSNGEYVVKAAAVARYGIDRLHAINSGRVAKFASGGLVGNAPSSGGPSGIVELGPKSLQRLSREVTNNIMLDDISIAQAANRGNSQLNKFGSR